MNVTTYAVAPYTYFRQHDELVGALDRLFREHRVPPAIVQYSFADRRATGYYDELVYILTPFPTRPTSELLEDIGRAVAPAQARLTTLLSCHYPPVFPPLPVTPLYAPPNEENFTVARSYLQPADDYRGRATPGGFQSTFESTMAIETSESNLIKSTLRASYVVKPCSKRPATATLTITCPRVTLQHQTDSNHHPYILHSFSASVRQDPHTPAGCTITPHFTPRNPRFERTCNGLRYESTWIWEVLDEQLRISGFAECDDRQVPVTAVDSIGSKPITTAGKSGDATHSNTEEPIAHVCSQSSPSTLLNKCSKSRLFEPPTESIVVSVPISSGSTAYPLCVTFIATLTSTAGLDAIDFMNRSSKWTDPQAREGLQSAFDKAHPAAQVIHHVIRVEIPDVAEMIRARMGYDGMNSPTTGTEVESLGPGIGVYAHRCGGDSFFGGLQISLDRDAGVVGRRGDENEEDNSDEEE
ncbi:hypothetical protein BN14_03262 [Rhizoctonia solani AG-1 IB]|uniref:Uncharacterized protein n=3 Tax=Rhizoctonia solani TaxID=456999 RepID=A0A8H3BC71_9AGAM|nr:unnamed protein product [Rhizoctonia solani]CCO29255.1 hypothetical protein BN14_03262 [Rhizoctonia solani AG-1 IB]